jgi:GntR family transcriptional regulator
MTDSLRYRQVADGIRRRIGAGDYPSGALETEAELCRLFAVSRITVRKALELLKGEGIVVSRKGSGWRVAVDPLRQVLGSFPTVEAAMRDDGHDFRRRVLEFTYEPVPVDVARRLGLAAGDDVLKVRRLNYADEHVFDVVTTWVPADIGAPLSRADVEGHGVFGSLRLHGVATGDVQQSVTAALATPEDATALGVQAGSPVLVVEQMTQDTTGRPIKFSEHRYPAHRIHLEVRIPGAAATAEPPGLRLLPAAERSSSGAPTVRRRRSPHQQ